MSKARLIITAVTLEGRSQAEVARDYNVSKSWVSKLIKRYKQEGAKAFEARSRKPHRSPTRAPEDTIEKIITLRKNLHKAGLDAGPNTIAWHLTTHHAITISPATISRHLSKAGLVIPAPKKRPKSSYIRFEAAMPNETWQSDFTHVVRITGPATAQQSIVDFAQKALARYSPPSGAH